MIAGNSPQTAMVTPHMLVDFLIDQFAWALGLGAVRQFWRLVGPRVRNFLREYIGAMEDDGQ